jgi:hypothetical protein
MKPLEYWNPKGFEISSYKWNLSDKINKVYKTSGSDNTGKCTYTYNELGFRADSINKSGFKVLSIGCSITEGVGVDDNQTWPNRFSQLIPSAVDFNFAMGGRSNDYISRCLLTYYDLIRPDLVLIMYTNPQRREVYTKTGEIEPFMPTASWGYMNETEDGKMMQNILTELQNDNEDYINWYKNHLLIKYFLKSNNCNWLWNGSFGISKDYIEFNRFDGDYSNYLDKGVDGSHPGPKHNYEYSIRLFEHIKDKFRDYLPNNISEVKRNLI